MFRRYNCTYCGDPCDSRDHVDPQSNSATGKVSFSTSYVIPACRECNTALGNRGGTTVGSRSDYLIDHYEWKYRDFIDGTKGMHDDEDINETTGTVKRMLKADKRKRDAILLRLEWLGSLRSKNFPT